MITYSDSQEELDIKARTARETRSILGEIFTESGVQTVLFYLARDYDTTVDDAWKAPDKFSSSLQVFLGDFGGLLVARRISERLSKLGIGPKDEVSEDGTYFPKGPFDR